MVYVLKQKGGLKGENSAKKKKKKKTMARGHSDDHLCQIKEFPLNLNNVFWGKK